jgi:molybdate transport system substrate-binding protein
MYEIKKSFIVFVCLLFAGISGRGEGAKPTPAPGFTVFAAASLSDVLPQVAKAWDDSTKVNFNFDATSRLAVQIENDAPADVFFSADSEWMDLMEIRDLVDPSTREDVLTNELVVIINKKAKFDIATLADLRSSDVAKIGMAGENVPVSKYAQAAFKHAGVWETVLNKVIRGDNVRTALRWVAEGVVQAGVVYRTDTLVEPRVKIAIVIPPETYPDITYPIAVVKKSKNASLAKSFIKFCVSKEGKAIFKKAGFIPLQKVEAKPRK